MAKSLPEEMMESIKFKRELAQKIALQMRDDVKKGVLTSQTVEQNQLAIDNLDAATNHLAREDFEKAIHFFSRGCANMGEFKGRSDKERKVS